MLKILNQIPFCFFVVLAVINIYRFRNRLRDNDKDFFDKESSGNAFCLFLSLVTFIASVVGLFVDYEIYVYTFIRFFVIVGLLETVSPTAIKELPKDREITKSYKIRMYVGEYVTFIVFLWGFWEFGKGMY